MEEHQKPEAEGGNQERRHKKKLNGLLVWIDFAVHEGRTLFGDLFVKLESSELEKKLCIDIEKMEV